MNRARNWVLGLLTAAVLLGGGMVLRTPAQRWLARHWQRQWDTADDARAAHLVRRVADLGAVGVPVVVEGLGSRRECVARAAGERVNAWLDEWKSQRLRQSSPKLALLARSLAESVDDFPPTARLEAARLATRILELPLDPNVADRCEVAQACETVLRASERDRQLRASAARPELPKLAVVPIDQRDAAGARAKGAAESGPTIADLTHLPGGNLLPESLPEPRLAGGPASNGSLAGRPSTSIAGEASEPRWFNQPGSAKPIRMGDDAPRLLGNTPQEVKPLAPTEPRSMSEVGDTTDERDKRMSRRGVSPEPFPSARRQAYLERRWTARPEKGWLFEGPATPLRIVPPDRLPRHQDLAPDRPLADIETLELLRRWASRDNESGESNEASIAVLDAELSARGVGPVEREVGRRFFDSDPKTRLELVAALPGLSGVDGQAWLLRLCRDADAEVRLAAVSILATSGNPSLLNEVETLARSDRDFRIRRQADQMAARRSGRR